MLLVALTGSSANAQDRIYRCGNEYTNIVTRAQEKTCTLITTGNVTVVPADKATGAKSRRSAKWQRRCQRRLLMHPVRPPAR